MGYELKKVVFYFPMIKMQKLKLVLCFFIITCFCMEEPTNVRDTLVTKKNEVEIDMVKMEQHEIEQQNVPIETQYKPVSCSLTKHVSVFSYLPLQKIVDLYIDFRKTKLLENPENWLAKFKIHQTFVLNLGLKKEILWNSIIGFHLPSDLEQCSFQNIPDSVFKNFQDFKKLPNYNEILPDTQFY